jgi:hypothetical protein
MSGFSGREFGRGNVAVRHVAVLVGFQWRLQLRTTKARLFYCGRTARGNCPILQDHIQF